MESSLEHFRGLSASMGVALMIPVTYSMSPSLRSSCFLQFIPPAIYGGSITASLINTPGTPASAATAMDGFALTKRGEGLKAIGVCLIASMMWNLSAIMLLVMAEPSPAFPFVWPCRYCLMGVLACLLSVAWQAKTWQGPYFGLIGVFIGTIGLDAMLAVPHFTFGSISMENGINTVPAMIGMFALHRYGLCGQYYERKRTALLDDPFQSLAEVSCPRARK